MTRAAVIEDRLSAWGWGSARRWRLADDASFRRYERLSLNGTTAVLMDAPPQKEDVRPFLAVAGWLRAQGFSAPAVLAADIDAGLVLLEDLGDELFMRVIAAAPAQERRLYSRAVDLLVALHAIEPPKAMVVSGAETLDLAPYGRDALMAEARLFAQWYVPAALGPMDEACRTLDAIWQRVIAPVAGAGEVMVLRDYHADNLVWLPDRPGVAAVGLLDFQDALCGHAAYDLVSLLQDARRSVSVGLEDDMIGRYLDGRRAAGADIDEAAFRRAYAILGAQRNAKIIGIFTRLCRRDGKGQYLSLIPHVWQLLERNLVGPELGELKAWLDDHIPQSRRQSSHRALNLQ